MEDERQTDHTDDPREQGVGQGGYPESSPDQTTPSGDDQRARSGGDASDDAPSPSTGKEADRGASTGNPGAAG